jgi:hypothetical protein
MERRGTIYDRDGNPLEDADIVPDGGTLRVPVSFLDSNDSLAARLRALSPQARNALGLPPHPYPVHDGMGGPGGFRAGYSFLSGELGAAGERAKAEAYAAFKDRLSNAWRQPAKVAAHHDGDYRDRESAYAAYKQRLSNAWRTAR